MTPRTAAAVLLLSAALQSPAARGAVLSGPQDCGSLNSRLLQRPGEDYLWRLAREADACGALRTGGRIRAALGDYPGARDRFERALKEDSADAAAAYALAEILRETPEQALPYALSAARSAPTARRKAEALRLAAEIQRDLDKDGDARGGLERALELRPDDFDGLHDMAALLRGEPSKAKYYARRALEAAGRAPSWLRADAYRRAARVWTELGDEAMAEESLRRALDADPDDLDALRALADARRRAGLPQAAPPRSAAAAPPARRPRGETELEKALAADPDDLDALRELVALRRREKRLPEAKESAERFTLAVDAAPEWQRASAYRSIAEAWSDLGETEKAKQCILAAWLMSTHDLAVISDLARWKIPAPYQQAAPSDIRIELARAKSDVGDQAGALAEIDAALSGDVAANILDNAAQIEYEMGQSRRALEHIERLLRDFKPAAARDRSAILRRKAQAQRQLKDYRGAETSVAAALNAAPEDAEALREAVTVERLSGRPRDALPFIERLVKSSEHAPPSERAAALAQKAQLQLELKDYASARSTVREALALSPDSRDALREAARIERSSRDEAEARADAEERASERADPRKALSLLDRLLKSLDGAAPRRLAELYRRRARLQHELKDLDGARASAASALALVPDDSEALRQAAQIERDAGRPSAALEFVGRLLAVEPGDARALADAIQIALAAGRPESALTYAGRLVESLSRAPAAERADAWRRKASVQRQLKDEAGARTSLAQALSLTPELFAARRDLATLELFAGRPGAALAALSREPDPGSRAAWRVLRGAAKSLAKDEAGARAEFQAAIKTDAAAACGDDRPSPDLLGPSYFDACLERFPKLAHLYVDRGVARYRAGERDAAISDFGRALELQQDYPEAALSLAYALAAQKRTGEAIAVADKALSRASSGAEDVYAQLESLRRSLAP